MGNSDIIQVQCSNCGATNRVSSSKIRAGLSPKCGKCKELLQWQKNP
ncbi:MJ0042-type zinc finger domain-containing protein [Candidatus Poribacteria bacterium]